MIAVATRGEICIAPEYSRIPDRRTSESEAADWYQGAIDGGQYAIVAMFQNEREGYEQSDTTGFANHSSAGRVSAPFAPT